MHNWKTVKLGDVCEIVMGQSPPSGTYNTDGIGLPFFQGKAEFTELYPVVRKWCSQPNKIAEPLDILISVRAPVGSTNIANQKCCIGRGLAALRYTKCYRYIFYYFRLIEQKLDELGTGSTFKAISSTTLRNVEIPFPTLPEQRKIVNKIEELFSGLDSGVASLKKAKEQIRLYRQSVLASAFSGKLVKDEKRETKNKLKAYLNGVQVVSKAAEPHQDYQDSGIDGIKTQKKSNGLINPENPQILLHHGSDNLPDGWKWVKLGEVCDKIQDGSHFSPQIQHSQKSDGKFLYITSKNIRNNYLDLNNVTYVDKEFHNSIFQRCNPEFGDVLLTKDGANTGNVTINTLKEEFSLLSSVCLIKPNKQKINSHFIKYYLQSPSGFKAVTGAMTGTAIKRIILKTIKDADIILPPIIQQTQIVEEIEKRFSEADNLEKAIDESLAKSERLRQSILKKAFEGRLV